MDHATLNQYFDSDGNLLDHHHNDDVNKRAGTEAVGEVHIYDHSLYFQALLFAESLRNLAIPPLTLSSTLREQDES
jgi:hypothetical protein